MRFILLPLEIGESRQKHVKRFCRRISSILNLNVLRRQRYEQMYKIRWKWLSKYTGFWQPDADWFTMLERLNRAVTVFTARTLLILLLANMQKHGNELQNGENGMAIDLVAYVKMLERFHRAATFEARKILPFLDTYNQLGQRKFFFDLNPILRVSRDCPVACDLSIDYDAKWILKNGWNLFILLPIDLDPGSQVHTVTLRQLYPFT